MKKLSYFALSLFCRGWCEKRFWNYLISTIQVQKKKNIFNNADKWHIRPCLIFIEIDLRLHTHILHEWLLREILSITCFYLHILVTTYPDVTWWKNLQKEWKTTVHFFPECEKVNNRFTKTINGIFWLVRIFWATRLFWRFRIFFTETFWIVKIFRTFRIFSCLRIFCVYNILIFWLNFVLTIKKFFIVIAHSRTSWRNWIAKKKSKPF